MLDLDFGFSAVGFSKLGFPETTSFESDSEDWRVFGLEVFGEGTDEIVGMRFNHVNIILLNVKIINFRWMNII